MMPEATSIAPNIKADMDSRQYGFRASEAIDVPINMNPHIMRIIA